MNFITGLIVGLFLGWVIKWLLDRYFQSSTKSQPLALETRSADQGELNEKLVLAETQINQLKQQPSGDFERRQKLAEAEAEIRRLRARVTEHEQALADLRAAQVEMAQRHARVAETSQPPLQAQDYLERIHGIGPVFARRFNEAGIRTFAELAQLTPERVREIVSVKEWQKIEPDEWIVQARHLANT